MTQTLHTSPNGLHAVRQTVAGYDGPRDLDGQLRLADFLAKAKTAVPTMYRDEPGDVLAGIYTAIALNIPVTSALHHLFYGGNGRAGMSAALMQGLILRAGHTVVIDVNDLRAEGILTRGDGRPDGTASWTMAEAAAARLTLNDVWLQFPTDCLYARCLARLARRFAADVVLGFGYVAEELTNGTDDDQAPAGTVQQERPVAPQVIELLAGLDDLDYKATVKVMEAAKRQGLDREYAGEWAGVPLTVMQVLVNHATAVRPTDTALVGYTAAFGVEKVTEAPAGEGVLDCGCLAATVQSTGSHVPDVCTRTAP